MQISQSDPDQPAPDRERQVRQGEDVRVRGARWRVVDVQPHDACRVLTLMPLDGERGDTQRRVIEPFDLVERVGQSRQPRVVGPRRWRRACRALIAGDTPPHSLSAARLAHIALMRHQLEPALAVLAGLGTRVLLADAVGLGKTIEAALIISELQSRGWIDRVLVLTPAGLRDQWRHELADRFDIDAVHVDAAALRRIAGNLPVGVNPWTTVPTAIASVDYVKRAEVLPAVRACRWDVVVVDEAHGVVGDSERHGAVRVLAAHAAYVLLLTATPHNGDAAAYEALRSLGCVEGDPLLTFRRTRTTIRDQPERRVQTLRVRQNRRERRVHAALARYGYAVGAEADGAALAMSVLHKRAYSSAWALQQSVQRRLASLAANPDAAEQQLALPLGDGMGEFSTADDAPEWPQELALADPQRERALLTAVAAACQAAVSNESKLAAIARLLRRVAEPAIVFTEYRDTLLHLHQRLSGIDVVVLHGGLNRQERANAVRRFSAADRRIVLLATDAAGEGLNLHQRCRLVVNLELPWNPMRLEQRIGRVDRIGQTRRVHVVHLVARGTGESGLFARLQSRIARAQRDIGSPNPLGGDIEIASSEIVSTISERACVETRRLGVARAFTTAADGRIVDQLESDGPWITSAPKLRRARARVGPRAALIVQTSFENTTGRRLASRLRAVLLDGISRVRTHDCMKRMVRDLAEAAVHHVESLRDDWTNEATGALERFVAARLARERTIAAAGDSASAAPFQAGLFDRRAERTHDSNVTLAVDTQLETAARIAALESAAALGAVTHRVLLAMLP